MSRGLSEEMEAAILDPLTRPVLLFQGSFKTGVLRLWTGIGALQWNDQIWTGAGDLMGVSPVEETDDIQANGVGVTFSGVKTDKITLALTEVARNLPGQIWLALLTEAGQVIPEPKTWFRGRLDVCNIDDSADGCTISINYENEMIDFERPRETRYTDQEQKRLYPDDLGLEFVSGMVDKTLRWGSTQ